MSELFSDCTFYENVKCLKLFLKKKNFFVPKNAKIWNSDVIFSGNTVHLDEKILLNSKIGTRKKFHFVHNLQYDFIVMKIILIIF